MQNDGSRKMSFHHCNENHEKLQNLFVKTFLFSFVCKVS